jgi:hypothetical protein
MRYSLLTISFFLIVVTQSVLSQTGSISMEYFDQDCGIYLTSTATWTYSADTSGLCYTTIAVCENPDELPFYLLDKCKGTSDTIPVMKGNNTLSLEYTMMVSKNIPYTAGLWQKYKLDDGDINWILDNGLGVSGKIEAWGGSLPGVIYDTVRIEIFDTVTVADTIRAYLYDTITVTDTIYIIKDLSSGINIAPDNSLNIVIKYNEITANFIFQEAEIYDLNGRLLLKVYDTSSIPILTFNQGYYILKARLNNKWIQTKFMKYGQ